MKPFSLLVASSCIFLCAFLTGCGGGGSSSGSGGTTPAAPTVTAISPTSVIAGSGQLTLTVTGTGFLSSTTVQVGGAADATTYVSSTQVTATVTPQQLASGAQLSVIALNGTASSGSGTAINLQVNNPVPTISSFAPAVAVAGAAPPTIVVTGTGFVPTTVIDVNGGARTTTYVSATQLNVTLTAADVATTGSLSLTAVNAAPGGGTSTASTIAVNNPAPGGPITVSPAVVLTGTATPTTVTVTGANFIPASVVELGGVATPTTYVSSTQLTFQLTVAEEATTQQITVGVMTPAPGGGTLRGTFLDILPPTPTPVITQVSPTQFTVGSGATTITVYGTNLVPALTFPVIPSSFSVLWNGTALTAQEWGSPGYGAEFITAVVPASLLASKGTATITVSSATSTPSTSNALTVTIGNPPPPTLTSLSPNAGPINTAATITLNGTGFTSGSTVALDGTNIAATYVSSTQLTVTVPASSVALPGNLNFTVTTPAPGGGTSAPLSYTAYISIPNNGMAVNPVNGLFYVSVPSSAGAPYGNCVVSVDPETGALGTPIPVGSEPDQLAISSDGTTLWVGLDGASAVREVNLITGVAGMQFSFSNNSGTYAYPPLAHAIAVLPGHPNSIVVSSALDQYTYEDMLEIYDSGVPRTNHVALSTISSLPAIFVSPTKAEVYATSYESGYQVLSYNSNGLQSLAGNTGTDNFSAPYGTAVQVDNGVAYLDSGLALNAETGALLGTFYSSGTTVATGPIVSDSKLGKLFILENANSNSTPTSAMIQAFNESNFTPIPSGTLQVNGAVSGTRYGAGSSTATELNGNNPINTMVRWGADGLAFRAANGVFSFRSSIVKDLSAVSADLSVTIAASGSDTTGQNTTYTATIKNAGPSASTNIALTVTAPSTGVLLSAAPSSGTCSTTGAVTCDLGGLSSGASATVNFVISQQTAGESTLSVQVTGSENDPNLANNQASSSVAITGSAYGPAPTIVSVTPAAILAGSSDTQITVTGSGFTSASSISIGGTPLPTNELSSTQLTAMVPAADLTSLGWTTVSVSTPAPGGGNSAALPLTIFNVISLDANHILYDPYSRKIMASIASGSTSITGNSIVAITPETSTVATPVPIGSQPINMALTLDGQILYTILSGSQSVARFNMLTQAVDYTYAIQPGTGTDTSPAPRGIATQPGTENTVAIDLGSWAGNAIYQFDPANKTAAMVGQASGPYSGSCITFLDAGDMLAFDTDTSGATFDHYTVTSAGFTYYDYSQYTESTLNGFGCFKLSGGLAFGNAGGVANPATNPATQIGLFPVGGGGEFDPANTLAPDTSLQSAFFLVDTETEGITNYSATVDGVESFNQNTFLPAGSLNLNMETIEGNTSYTGVDLIRWGQDGLAALTSGGHIYLVRGAFVVPQLLGTNSAASLKSSSVTSVTHGAGNTLLTLTGANFVPGVAVTWNGSYRTTTIVDATHVTVAIPAGDLLSDGSGKLIATNPGATGSNALTVTIN
jgi:trimeric autotransporter adhesin